MVINHSRLMMRNPTRWLRMFITIHLPYMSCGLLLISLISNNRRRISDFVPWCLHRRKHRGIYKNDTFELNARLHDSQNFNAGMENDRRTWKKQILWVHAIRVTAVKRAKTCLRMQNSYPIQTPRSFKG